MVAQNHLLYIYIYIYIYISKPITSKVVYNSWSSGYLVALRYHEVKDGVVKEREMQVSCHRVNQMANEEEVKSNGLMRG